MKAKHLKTLKRAVHLTTIIGFLLISSAVVILLIPSLPQLWYTLNNNATNIEVNNIVKVDKKPIEHTPTNTDNRTIPPFNPELPTQNFISIPSIGVFSPINEGENYTEILKNGTWIVNDFARPNDNFQPIILAAHRFGYITWTAKERKELSFFNLPKLQNGDTVSIIWNQREYKYQIIKSEEGETISDYSTDLILYTCQLYNSPIRIFKYAKRIN